MNDQEIKLFELFITYNSRKVDFDSADDMVKQFFDFIKILNEAKNKNTPPAKFESQCL